ncbi:TIGR03985 family CRISPR-associated protein [Anabaena sphaerica FACHB-251]|uniref:TIGR03985 family CRISPR-associated protein n=1 Tax=Anabaena sphaerica FACHB-251 TaxID=2692883 RepID=A0A926WKI1_9NOST|nr:TIGR03985 family CRISPR-associated protein [Anabaena sphaerica]MBD2295121.1 TIGR03985 family CRISPR-associated protein [Anabaena sphaerica FACHB-251]
MTNDYLFTDIPQVELLQWLARGSLKQNLSRSIRLWVWLRSLYGEDQERLPLTNGFTLADWRDAFFTATHPKGEAIPKLHDPHCNCAKTTAVWLFNENTGISESEWKRSLISHLGISQSPPENIPPISSTKNINIIQSVGDLEKLLQQRLFAVTRRSLQADLTLLAELGWLEYNGEKYYHVQKLPSRPITHKINSADLDFLNQEDLADIARNLSQNIAGVQRFFLKLDYVVTATDEVDNWQYELKQLWQQTPVPPIKLTYDSARLGQDVECFVYPVCVYYVQRAVYLCAFGQSPDRKTDWYNFRLDRIQDITAIDWTNPQIPSILQQRYHQRDLPNPEEIELQMSKSWGFDFYLPSRIMLLRFERDYHDRYIQNTFRHDTFELISHAKAKSLIRQYTPEQEQQQTLIKLLDSRSPDDAYYKVNYRHGDNNVIMRLRAWRPKLEVIMPQDLRQKIAADITKEMQFYQDLLNL